MKYRLKIKLWDSVENEHFPVGTIIMRSMGFYHKDGISKGNGMSASFVEKNPDIFEEIPKKTAEESVTNYIYYRQQSDALGSDHKRTAERQARDLIEYIKEDNFAIVKESELEPTMSNEQFQRFVDSQYKANPTEEEIEELAKELLKVYADSYIGEQKLSGYKAESAFILKNYNKKEVKNG